MGSVITYIYLVIFLSVKFVFRIYALRVTNKCIIIKWKVIVAVTNFEANGGLEVMFAARYLECGAQWRS